MSVAGIFSTGFLNFASQGVQNKVQQFQQDFQQLGQDLQSGNLSAAQSDFATLQQLGPQGSSSSSSAQSNNPIGQAFNQLAQDLQAGNLSAAQSDFSTLQQDLQNQATQAPHYHHHHHHGGGGNGSNPIEQQFAQLGQDLQSGNLSAAQQAYSSLQQEFQQLGTGGSGSSSGSTNSSSGSNSVSVSV